MDIQGLKRDVETIESGKWVEDIPGMGGLRLKVRGLSCKAYLTKLGRLSRAVPKTDRLPDGAVDPEVQARVIGEAMHATILLDWDGITEGDGGDVRLVPFDDARAKDMLTSPEWQPFADAVYWSAQVVDNERAKSREELAKNSQAPSVGASKKGGQAA